MLVERIGIVGGGFVGRAIARGFLEHAGEVRVHDVVPERSTHSLAEALDCDFTFVCVPTPAKPDGTCDTSYVEDVVKRAWQTYRPSGGRHRLVIKSTVPVGFTRRMADEWGRLGDGESGSPVVILHSPEFLTQRCAQVDFQTPARNIVGIPNWARLPDGASDESYAAAQALAMLYRQRFPGVPCLTMSSDESELVKLAQNSFFATKVAYFNVIAMFAQHNGLSFERIREGMLADGRIAHAHTAVPGPSDSRGGFSGSCLPKDLADLIHCLREAGFVSGPKWLAAMSEFNREIRGPNDRNVPQVRI